MSRCPPWHCPPASKTIAPWNRRDFIAASSLLIASLSVLPLSHHHQQFTPNASGGSENCDSSAASVGEPYGTPVCEPPAGGMADQATAATENASAAANGFLHEE